MIYVIIIALFSSFEIMMHSIFSSAFRKDIRRLGSYKRKLTLHGHKFITWALFLDIRKSVYCWRYAVYIIHLVSFIYLIPCIITYAAIYDTELYNENFHQIVKGVCAVYFITVWFSDYPYNWEEWRERNQNSRRRLK